MEELKEYLYQIVAWIARVHDSMWAYNRSFSSPFTDKELHFIVIGAFGLGLFVLTFLLFGLLTRLNRFGIMAWLFSFSTVLFVTFAIEIGQFVTNTGNMELADIVYGLVGFLAASVGAALLYALLRLLWALVRWLGKII